MKKFLSILLIVSMCVGLFACSKTESVTVAESEVVESQMAESQSVESQVAESQVVESQVAESVEEDKANTETHIVVDHGGNSVEVPNKIERIVVTGIWPLPAVLSVFFNSADKIVGIAPQSKTAAENSLLATVYPEILNAETNFTDGTAINIEELVKLKPDVVFYSENNKEQKETMLNAGIPAIGISANGWHYDCITTLNEWLNTLTEVFKYSDDISILTARSERAKEKSNEIYDMIKGRVSSLSDEEKKRVFFLFQYTDSAMLTSGENFFGQWWADAVGAINVANELKNDNSVSTNLEQVYAWNPEMIIITNFTTALPNDLYNNTIGSYDWSGVKAVADKEVYKMPLGMYRTYTPGIDTPITLLWFAKTVYPDIFSDVDLVSETRNYYKEIFDIDLTDDQIKGIFNPDANAGRTYFN